MSSVLVRSALLGLPLALLAQVVLAHGATAQEASLQEKYQKKISASWFTSGGWSDDYDAVRARAKKEGKVILAYFTRSFSP